MKYTTRNENKIQNILSSPTFDSVNQHIYKASRVLCKKTNMAEHTTPSKEKDVYEMVFDGFNDYCWKVLDDDFSKRSEFFSINVMKFWKLMAF